MKAVAKSVFNANILLENINSNYHLRKEDWIPTKSEGKKEAPSLCCISHSKDNVSINVPVLN